MKYLRLETNYIRQVHPTYKTIEDENVVSQ